MLTLVLGCVPELEPPRKELYPDHDFDGDGFDEEQGDCDDADAAIGPGTDEVCGDRIDNDCDGSPGACALSGTVDLGAAPVQVLGAGANDYLGWSVATGSLDDEGVDDVMMGAPGSVSAVYGFRGPLRGGGHYVDYADFTLTATSFQANGADLALVGDSDGNGLPDFASGAPSTDEESGSAYIVYNPFLENPPDSWSFGLGQTGSHFGESVTGLGDVNGDGLADWAAAATLADTTRKDDVGVVLVVHGAESRQPGAPADGLIGSDEHDHAGASVRGPGDLDGDGVPDMIVGAPGQDDGGAEAGMVYLVLAPFVMPFFLKNTPDVVAGARLGSQAGEAVDGAGDVNGDGHLDFVIGAPGSQEAFVFHGPVIGQVSVLDAQIRLGTDDAESRLGSAVAGAGDVDGDGLDEVLVGAPGYGAGSAGAAFMLAGGSAGDLDVADVSASFLGEADGDQAGHAVGGGGDMDGDGFDDILVGAPYRDGAEVDAGQVYLLFGGSI